MIVLTLNCGSSSVKYSVFNTKTQQVLARGVVDRIGLPRSFIQYETLSRQIRREVKSENHKAAIHHVLDLLVSPIDGILRNFAEVEAVAHRVVHGGEHFVDSVLIDQVVEKVIEELEVLAPLHNPHNLQGIRAAKDVLPAVPHVAVFDTAFHQTISDFVYRYAIPLKWYSDYGVRRYGFHGTSHYYVSRRAMALLGESVEGSRIITLHLGNGSSATAVKDGKSIDTSMGLTPLEGLIMGTRSGDMDPGAVLFMIRAGNLSHNEVDNILNRKSGMFGITGTMSDLRDIEKKAVEGDENALLALKMSAYRIRKYIGAYYVALGGLDAIVFTAGIGENSPFFRSLVLRNLEFMDVELDEDLNSKAVGGYRESLISTTNSKIKIFVIPTNEELVLAQEIEKAAKQWKEKEKSFFK
ncbi:MAG: acetate/propionate family kinase [Candidatus Odinarchaeota archaeon]